MLMGEFWLPSENLQMNRLMDINTDKNNTKELVFNQIEAELKKELTDSARVRTLISLSRLYRFSDFQRSKDYATEALAIADKSTLGRTRIIAFENIGTLSTLSGDYSTALRYDNQALQQSLINNDSTSIAVHFNNIANDYYDLGEYDEAYNYFTNSYRVASAR